MSTLRIQILFHWNSDDARQLASALYRTFSARPTGDGPRIPVRYGPKQDDGGPPTIDLTAKCEIIVILVDKRMARRAQQSDRPIADRWGALVRDLISKHGPDSTSLHRVLPVALDEGAMQLSSALDETSFVRLDYRQGEDKIRHLILHITIRALRVLQGLPRPPDKNIDKLPRIPVQLFISHAKKDLKGGLAEGPVKAILATLAQLPIAGWLDSAQIKPGSSFADAIKQGVLGSDALVAVLTDAWSTREWCRREVLEAKCSRRPLVVVDALEARVLRLFPYLGNAVTLRWRAAIAATQDAASDAWSNNKETWEKEDAALAIETALLEALRYRYEQGRLEGSVGENEIALGTPPEALTLAQLAPGTTRVWYPDPPLGREELDRLQPAAAKRIDLTTPLSELARWERPPGVQTVAVSLSNSPDTEKFGGSPEHLATFADDLVLYLLVAGLRVAYGGVLTHGALSPDGKVVGDDITYVQRLLAMVRCHSTLLSAVAGKPPIPIQNWVAWPLHLKLSQDDLDQYGQEAELVSLPRPPALDGITKELNAADDVFMPNDTPVRRYAWARSLTFMRESMREKTSARIAMGGRLDSFQGLWPGVLEEGVISLRASQPLYLLGLFGGAARLLIDALCGKDRPELTSVGLSKVKGWSDLRDEYLHRGQTVRTPEELAADLKQMGRNGLAAALNNGLTEAENMELVDSDDPQRSVALILSGLRHVLAKGSE